MIENPDYDPWSEFKKFRDRCKIPASAIDLEWNKENKCRFHSNDLEWRHLLLQLWIDLGWIKQDISHPIYKNYYWIENYKENQ